MNDIEAMRLCRLVASLCPAQRFDEETPSVWAGILDDVPLAAALAAVRSLGRTQPFIAPADIVQAVSRAHKAALDGSRGLDELLPNVNPDDVEAWAAERRAIYAAAAIGNFDPVAYAESGLTLTGAQPMRQIGGDPDPDRVQQAITAGVRLPAVPTPRRD